jgi:hypothetical protein
VKFLLATALVICFAAQTGKALAYACSNNYYVNSSGHVVHSPTCGFSISAMVGSSACNPCASWLIRRRRRRSAQPWLPRRTKSALASILYPV